ncbi:hypothetical protein ACFQH8_16785 [Halomicroarcula sp. GCM10025710]
MNREWECGIVDETVSRLIAMLLAGVIAFISIYRYVVFRFSGREFVHDAQVWAQIGDDVLAGMALYAQVPDNKPPLWEAVVIVAAATPVPFLVMLAVVGVEALPWYGTRTDSSRRNCVRQQRSSPASRLPLVLCG